MEKFHATTIVAVKKDGRFAMAGDGQVTFGENTIIKHNTKKVRTLYNGQVLCGFAGSAADAFALLEKFEDKLGEYHGNLLRASYELAKDWRTDRVLRQLNALLLAMNKEHILLLSGTGDIIEPDDDIAAIGSGGNYALAAGKALLKHSSLSAPAIAHEALKIASEICVYTNDSITVVELDKEEEDGSNPSQNS